MLFAFQFLGKVDGRPVSTAAGCGREWSMMQEEPPRSPSHGSLESKFTRSYVTGGIGGKPREGSRQSIGRLWVLRDDFVQVRLATGRAAR